MKTFPLAGDGVYKTIQGEGALMGVPMIFVRLAGCSVGCSECDTDYRVRWRVTAQEIADRVKELGPCEWTWITGGEPADHNLWPLVEALKLCGYVALATSGSKGIGGVRPNFISVSPHGKPSELVVIRGNQLNLVPGLNGLRLSDWQDFNASGFDNLYVTPCDGKPETIDDCRRFVESHRYWRLGVQQQKVWQIG